MLITLNGVRPNLANKKISVSDYASCQGFSPVMFTGDAYLSKARNPNTGMLMSPLRNSSKDPFEMTGKGVKIVDQTGIVQANRGYGYVVFAIENGYKIEKGNNIDVLPKVQNAFTGALQDGDKQQYVIEHDMTPVFMVSQFHKLVIVITILEQKSNLTQPLMKVVYHIQK